MEKKTEVQSSYEASSNKNPSSFGELPHDVLGHILSFSKNPSTFFGINIKFRHVALKYRDPNHYITLTPNTTYYIVGGDGGSLDSHDGHGNPIPLTKKRIDELRDKILTKPLYTLETREFNDTDQAKTLYITREQLNRRCNNNGWSKDNILAKLSNNTFRTHCTQVRVIEPKNNMQEGILYIGKSERGLKYAILHPFYSFKIYPSEEGLNLLCLCQGEITTTNLPLLSCVDNQHFDVKKYEPYLDRMLAIIESRLQSLYQLVKQNPEAKFQMNPELPISPCIRVFCTEEEALKFTTSLNLVATHGTRYPLIHPCIVKHKVVLQKNDRGVVMLKSDLTLLEGSYPVDANASKVTIEETPSKKCIVM